MVRQHVYHLYMDASLSGWGATVDGQEAHGLWSQLEKETVHINVLEMRAVLLALQRFHLLLRGQNTALLMDNTAALAYIRNQGGTS